MKIYYEPTGINNFHNRSGLNLIISGKTDKVSPNLYLISKRQAQKIERHFCGVRDCHCPGGAVQQLDPDGTIYGIDKKWCA